MKKTGAKINRIKKVQKNRTMKTEIVRVRLNEVEKSILEKVAALNMTLSDYIKYFCLINRPKVGFEREADYK